jgi:ABC-type glutathione transport system ATPase component
MDVVVEEVSQIWPGLGGTSVVALERVSHRFRSGRITCLLGPSGCGKSTLIQIIAGLERATGGTVRIEDPQRHDIQHPLGADSVMAQPRPRVMSAPARSLPRSVCAASNATCPDNCPAACASASPWRAH